MKTMLCASLALLLACTASARAEKPGRQVFSRPSSGVTAFARMHEGQLPAFVKNDLYEAATRYVGIISGPNRTWINPKGDTLTMAGPTRRVQVRVQPAAEGHSYPTIVKHDRVQDPQAKNFNHSVSRYQQLDERWTYLTDAFGYDGKGLSSLFHGFVDNGDGRGTFKDLPQPAPRAVQKTAGPLRRLFDRLAGKRPGDKPWPGSRTQIPPRATVEALRKTWR